MLSVRHETICLQTMLVTKVIHGVEEDKEMRKLTDKSSLGVLGSVWGQFHSMLSHFFSVVYITQSSRASFFLFACLFPWDSLRGWTTFTPTMKQLLIKLQTGGPPITNLHQENTQDQNLTRYSSDDFKASLAHYSLEVHCLSCRIVVDSEEMNDRVVIQIIMGSSGSLGDWARDRWIEPQTSVF